MSEVLNQQDELNQNDFLKKVEDFYNKNKQIISGVAIGIAAIVIGYFAFTLLYLEPQQKEAQTQIYKAQGYFAVDSFDLALNGDGNYLGFLAIIDKYGMTKAANLSKYYAGICYLKTGQFQEAIDHLKGFSSNDLIVKSIALSGIGDAYMELGEKDNALSYYQKAIDASENSLTAPIIMKKTAMAFESNEQYEKAAKIYKSIKEQYPNSAEGRDIDKYIARAEARKTK
jgi:tetratricopeptide (TPR) repeat protein